MPGGFSWHPAAGGVCPAAAMALCLSSVTEHGFEIHFSQELQPHKGRE